VCRRPFDPFIYHGRSVNAHLTLIGRARRSIGRIQRAGGPPHRQPWLYQIIYFSLSQYLQFIRYPDIQNLCYSTSNHASLVHFMIEWLSFNTMKDSTRHRQSICKQPRVAYDVAIVSTFTRYPPIYHLGIKAHIIWV
jgi:hypothetical protein